MQSEQLACEGRLPALEDDGHRARGLGQRALGFQGRAVLGVLPLQGEDLLVLLAAELLQDRRTPATGELPLEIGERRRDGGIEEEAQRHHLAARPRILPGSLDADDAIGIPGHGAFRVAGGSAQCFCALAQIGYARKLLLRQIEIEAAVAAGRNGRRLRRRCRDRRRTSRLLRPGTAGRRLCRRTRLPLARLRCLLDAGRSRLQRGVPADGRRDPEKRERDDQRKRVHLAPCVIVRRRWPPSTSRSRPGAASPLPRDRRWS